MISIDLSDTLILTRHSVRVELEHLERAFQVRALVQMGYSGDVARAFGYSGGELSKVKLLAQRVRLITEAS